VRVDLSNVHGLEIEDGPHFQVDFVQEFMIEDEPHSLE